MGMLPVLVLAPALWPDPRFLGPCLRPPAHSRIQDGLRFLHVLGERGR